MVDRLRETGSIRSPEVAEAFAKVPREKFVPEAELAAAYSYRDHIVTKRSPDGWAMSSVSAPWLQAQMLEAARIGPGARVWEIGSGGYNAALIAELVGPEGSVISMDIDPFVTERAARFLAETGYPHVKVVLGDAEHAAEEFAPFDAILVTVGVWDCPWGHLLAPEGRMVVPLRFAGITRAITFSADGDRLVGLDPTVCGFVPVQGAGAHRTRLASLAGGAVTLTIDGGPDLDTAALDRALASPRTVRWTSVEIGDDVPFDTMHLWLATVDDTFGIIWRDPDAGDDLAEPALRWFTPALITPGSFAYLTMRDIGLRCHEFGVRAHGPGGEKLAQRLLTHVQTWDRDWRDHPGPAFALYPKHAAVPVPVTGRVFQKRHTQLVLEW
ncbi:protein-L-isoaspartate(D-aspartate) O-methyltransferase [Nonomuraea solani]|uniref:Protein-L-isoaspartate O-methyltransferase n=2 Tax=Nonomuraea solani TaxID=1144553 RepID=A0A1H6BSN6_9ACTN|nr:protein-L-isoaspartate(D-aspartate) O-methyltransferase [Nonomuraea solani]